MCWWRIFSKPYWKFKYIVVTGSCFAMHILVLRYSILYGRWLPGQARRTDNLAKIPMLSLLLSLLFTWQLCWHQPWLFAVMFPHLRNSAVSHSVSSEVSHECHHSCSLTKVCLVYFIFLYIYLKLIWLKEQLGFWTISNTFSSKDLCKVFPEFFCCGLAVPKCTF